MQQGENHLSRSMSTLGLVATGVSSMIGASIYIVPFMIQKNVPGIGPYVLPAFLFAAIPALLAAFAYAILSSAMPRAGGSYIYVSRSINAYWGFVASFSQWFGLSIVIGVVAYMVIPFFSDIAGVIHNQWLSDFLASRSVRLIFSLLLLWLCILVNIVGIKTYQLTIIVLVGVTFVFSSIVLIIGLIYNQHDYLLALVTKEGKHVQSVQSNFNFTSFLSASAILFASFIGFDSIAQAGGEAKNPSKSLPRAIIITFCSVAIFYLAFTYSVYNIVPWNYMYELALVKDISAPGLLSILLSPFWSLLIILGACIALLKDLPSMILSVSRLVFAWSKDELFPSGLVKIHKKYNTPHWAIIFSGALSSIGILGSHFASDIFLGIDIMVISMVSNFILICVAVLLLPIKNPEIAKDVSIFKKPFVQKIIAISGLISLSSFLLFNINKDLMVKREAWYFHSTLVWIVVIIIASIVFIFHWRKLKLKETDPAVKFRILPQE